MISNPPGRLVGLRSWRHLGTLGLLARPPLPLSELLTQPLGEDGSFRHLLYLLPSFRFICFRLSALFASGFLAPAFLLHLFLLLDSEEFAPAVEILFHNQTETLSVEAVSGEIAVVGLIIHAHGEITVREDEITEIEVADKTLCGIRIVAIAKLTIEQ